MKNLIDRVIFSISSLLQRIQTKRFLAVVLGGLLLLTTNVGLEQKSSEALGATVQERVRQDSSERPRTTREWQEEARETEGNPGKRLQRIKKESGQALKEFGSGYVEGGKETARDIRDNVKQAGKDLSN